MGNKPTMDWKAVETYQRVLATIIATGAKIGVRETARYVGVSYDTIENGLRPIKKAAKAIKDEFDSGKQGEVTTPSRTKSTPATPRQNTPKKSALEPVSTGRVTKTIGKSNINRNSFKQETISEEDFMGSSLGHLIDVSADSALHFAAGMEFDMGDDMVSWS